MEKGMRLEFFLIPYEHGYIRLDIFDMTNFYEVMLKVYMVVAKYEDITKKHVLLLL